MPIFSSEKFVSADALADIVHNLRQRGATIVSTNGSFDLLHLGHVTMLREAKSLGDVLIVGLNSDQSVRRYKGRHRPICPQAHRAAMLAALECTDYITIFDDLTPLKLLHLIQPDIHVNSPEHGKDCIEREVVEHYGGRIHLARLIEGLSTTQLIGRILQAARHQAGRGLFVNARDLIKVERTAGRSRLQWQADESTLADFGRLTAADFQLFLFADHADLDVSPSAEDDLRTAYQQVPQEFCQHGVTLSNVSLRFRASQPDTALLEDTIGEADISLAQSVIISSNPADIRLGRAVNCKTILLAPPAPRPDQHSPAPGPHHVVDSLHAAIALLLGPPEVQPG
jgi:D-glycero-beta-D-manno-heptose 1-phosphate adenylyltransferase